MNGKERSDPADPKSKIQKRHLDGENGTLFCRTRYSSDTPGLSIKKKNPSNHQGLEGLHPVFLTL